MELSVFTVDPSHLYDFTCYKYLEPISVSFSLMFFFEILYIYFFALLQFKMYSLIFSAFMDIC
jgi:hypothetical protein